jgi:ribonucleoside-diphosphate reductase alpha chain
MRFEPAGMTDDPDIRISQSMMDYIFRRLALDHLTFEQREALGIYSAAERAAEVQGNYTPAPAADLDVDVVGADDSAPVAPAVSVLAAAPVQPGSHSAPKSVHSSAELLEAITGTASDAPLCMTCGIKMRPAGSCYVCEGCGSTSGCS